MNFFRQTKDTFIRIYDEMGYVTNQLTWQDRIFEETGRDFLSVVKRDVQEVNFAVNILSDIYQEIPFDEIYKDFVIFLRDLENEGFILTGDTLSEIEESEPSFSYDYRVNKIKNLQDETLKIDTTSTEDYLYQFHKRKPTLFAVQFELTSKCNERCIHCYIPNSKKDKAFSLDYLTLIKTLEEARNMGVLSITLSGGEPFLYKEINSVINKCRELDFQISILSNLTRITDDNLNVLRKSNISQIQVSLYSMKPEEHDKVTMVPGSFKKTMHNIEKLIENNIPIVISTPIMKTNVNSYKDVLIWAESKNLKTVTDYILMAQSNFSTSNLDYRIDLNETKVLIQDIVKNNKNYSALLNAKTSCTVIDDKKNKDWLDQPICGVGMDVLCLGANGDFYPCSGWQNYAVGNVYSKSLSDIWLNSEKLNNLRKIRNKDFEECVNCDLRDYCAMCLVRNFNESNGDLYKINKHYCKVALINKQVAEEYLLNK